MIRMRVRISLNRGLIPLLISSLLMVLCLGGCAENSSILDNGGNRQLEFSVMTHNWSYSVNSNKFSDQKVPSRATPISGSTFDTSKSFNVIADVNKGSDWSTEVDNETASYSSTNEIWQTSKTHYWPGAGSTVNFYAYYPTNISSNITHTAGSAPALSYTVPDNAADQIDILTSSRIGIAGDSYNQTPVDFKHIFAAIQFSVGSSGLPSGTISSISISNVANSGTYTFGSGWSDVTGSKTFILFPSTTISGTSGESIMSGTYTLIMIPQAFSNAVITLTYNTGTTYTKTISGTWSTGNTYTYNLSKLVNIGDYYYNDGTWGSIAEHTNSTASAIGVIFSNSTSNIDKGHSWTHGYAMALTNASIAATWGIYNQDTPLENLDISVSGWKYASNLKDGYTNTQKIKNTYEPLETNYPAFYYAVNYNTTYPVISSGWYLASIGQWYDICVNLGKISETPDNSYYNGVIWHSMSSNCINNINADLKILENLGYRISKFSIGEKYWTSTESDSTNAFYIYFADVLYIDQNIDDGLRKNGSWIIRPVIAF